MSTLRTITSPLNCLKTTKNVFMYETNLGRSVDTKFDIDTGEIKCINRLAFLYTVYLQIRASTPFSHHSC
jgi:hypothetical protein